MSQNPITILIVEDNPGVSHVLELLLRHAGFNVLLAEDGEQGCILAERKCPSLIICDEQMPRLNGYGTLVRLKHQANTADIPVIMTGGTDHNGQHDWLALGAAAFFPKPFEIKEVVSLVKRVLFETSPSKQSVRVVYATGHAAGART